MRKNSSFTLIELMIVIIILGVLATLGVTNFLAAIEKARGSEARKTLGMLRTMCAAIYMGSWDTANCNAQNCGMCECCAIPDNCCPKYFFLYSIENATGSSVTFKATRCIDGTGKSPSATIPHTLTLTTNYVTGTDDWASTGGY